MLGNPFNASLRERRQMHWLSVRAFGAAWWRDDGTSFTVLYTTFVSSSKEHQTRPKLLYF